jgi:HK97 gp10 family phage protein
MANIINYEIKGLDQLQKALEEKGKAARLAVRVALSAGGGTVKDQMEVNAPVEENSAHAGFLRDHIKVQTRIARNGTSGRAIVGPTQDEYPGSGKTKFNLKIAGRTIAVNAALTAARVGRFLEFGTSKMGKHPWLTSAWEATKGAALNRIVEKLKSGLGV